MYAHDKQCNTKDNIFNSSDTLSRRSFISLLATGTIGAFLGTRATSAFATEEGVSQQTASALASAQAQYQSALNELSALNEQVESAQYELSQTQAQLDDTNAKISELEDSITQKQAELSQAQDALADRIGSNYKVGKTNALEVILNAQSFEDFVNRIYLEGKVSDQDAEAIQAVKDIKADLESQQNELQTQRSEQETLLEQQQANADALSQRTADMQSYANGLSSEVVALMNQAQAEAEAARQAQYEQYLAQQQASEQAAASDGGTTESTGDQGYQESQNTNTDTYVDNGGTTDYSGGASDNGSSYNGGSSSGGTGNHAGSVVDIAFSYIGVPYVWGGSDPSGFDCSGLAQYCYAMAGYSIPRDTYGQIAQIQALGNWKTSMSELQPGDLAFPHEGHVGIYCGGGMWIHAPYPGESVQYTSVYGFIGGGSPI